MRVLYCLVDGRQDYTPISEEQERKLTAKIREKAMPPTFKLGDKTIATDTIIGFTDNPDPKPVSSTNFDEWRQRIHQSEWYKRSKANRVSNPA